MGNEKFLRILIGKTEGQTLLAKCIGNFDCEQNMSVKTWGSFFLLGTGSFCELLWTS